MKRIIFLGLSFLCLFFVKIYGNEAGNGLYLLIEDPDLRPIEEFSMTNNEEFNQLLETYNVYVFKKAYPTLPSREYLIKSSDDEKLKEELLLKFGENISFARIYSFGLEIGIEDPNLLPIEEKQFFLTKNPEFNQLLETYKVDIFLQAFPTTVTEFLQKTYMIQTPYQNELKEELLLKYSESIPLVEDVPGEGVIPENSIEYIYNDNLFIIKDGTLFLKNPDGSPVKINLYSFNGVKIKEVYPVTDEYSLKNNVSIPVLYEIIIGTKRYTGKYIFNQ